MRLSHRIAIASALVLTTSACVRESAVEPCDDESRCLPRYACVEGQCVPCELDACPTSRITLVSEGGGVACGAGDTDAVCVRFPRGALRQIVEVDVGRTREEPTNVPEPVVAKVYAVRPAFVVPTQPVEITMTVSRAVVPSQPVRVYTALDPRGPWTALETARAGQSATAFAPALGFFTLALDERVEVDPDAGPPAYPDAAPPVPINPVEGMGRPITIPGGVLRSLHGVAWDATTSRLFLADRDTSEIYTYEHTGALPARLTRYRTAAGRTYGLTVDGLGRVFMAEHETRSVTRAADVGPPVTVAGDFGGQPFHGPADVAVRSEGSLYFTDPSAGTGQPGDLDFDGVFRRALDGVVSAEWRGPRGSEPRGLELSPDEEVLYVSEASSQTVLAFDVAPNGGLSNRRAFARTEGPRPDGIAVDRVGNVYVGTTTGIEVFAPDGALWGRVPLTTPVGGLAFGGPLLLWLYAVAPDRVLLTTVTVAGAR